MGPADCGGCRTEGCVRSPRSVNPGAIAGHSTADNECCGKAGLNSSGYPRRAPHHQFSAFCVTSRQVTHHGTPLGSSCNIQHGAGAVCVARSVGSLESALDPRVVAFPAARSSHDCGGSARDGWRVVTPCAAVGCDRDGNQTPHLGSCESGRPDRVVRRYCGSKYRHPSHVWQMIGRPQGPTFECPGK